MFAVLYPYQKGTLKIAIVALSFLLLLAISVISFLLRKNHPYFLVGWLWYLGMLLPMIGLVQVGLQTRADRYTYLPSIGLYILATWGAMELFARWRRRREILAVAALLITTAFVTCSYFQSLYWRNSETLWKHANDSTSNNYMAQYSLGNVFLARAFAGKGNWADAMACYQAAIRISPNYAKVHDNLGVALVAVGSTDKALEQFSEALRIDRSSADAHYNLALVLAQLGRREEAVAHFTEALRLNPNYTEAKQQLRNLGVLLPRSDKGACS